MVKDHRDTDHGLQGNYLIGLFIIIFIVCLHLLPSKLHVAEIISLTLISVVYCLFIFIHLKVFSNFSSDSLLIQWLLRSVHNLIKMELLLSGTKQKWSKQEHKWNKSFLMKIYSPSQKSAQDTSQSPNAKAIHAISGLPCSPDSVTLIQMRKKTPTQPIS